MYKYTTVQNFKVNKIFKEMNIQQGCIKLRKWL